MRFCLACEQFGFYSIILLVTVCSPPLSDFFVTIFVGENSDTKSHKTLLTLVINTDTTQVLTNDILA